MRRCELPGCDRPHRAHGLCARHEARVRRSGRPELKRRPWTPAEDRKVLELPVSRSGAVRRGYRIDLALHLERSVNAVTMRRLVLLRRAGRMPARGALKPG